MSDLLIRGIDKKTLQRLKNLAKHNGRSVQSEAKQILQRGASALTPDEIRAMSLKWRRRLSGRKFPDSAELIREDRDSR